MNKSEYHVLTAKHDVATALVTNKGVNNSKGSSGESLIIPFRDNVLIVKSTR